MHRCGKCGDQILDTTLKSQQQVDRHKRLGTSGRDDTSSDLKVGTTNVELCRAEGMLSFLGRASFEYRARSPRSQRLWDAKSPVFHKD